MAALHLRIARPVRELAGAMRGAGSFANKDSQDESKMPRYRIVAARPHDINAIAAIELAAARLLTGHVPDAMLDEVTGAHELRAAQGERRLWVELFDDRPVGFAHVTLLEPEAAHLAEIDVHPAHGRRGLGRRLVAAVCRWAERHGYAAVTLSTFRDVAWNMPFYAGLGFEEVPWTACPAALRSVVQDEARRGLDPTRRVVMRWRTPAAIDTRSASAWPPTTPAT